MLELIKVKYDQEVKKQLEKRFIAFDVETTGLDPQKEKIIELGAVFLKMEKQYKSLIRLSMRKLKYQNLFLILHISQMKC